MMINPLMTNIPHHVETSELICSANQLTGFYIRATLALDGLIWKSPFAQENL